MKKIKVDLFNLKDLIKEIDSYEEWLNEKANELSKKLADVGLEEAVIRYNKAYYAGINDVKVTVEDRGDGVYALVARGEAVLFIEFGTGIYKMDAPDERAELIDGSAIVGHGQYGQGKGANPKGWVYRGSLGYNPPWGTREVGTTGVLTKGNHAASALYYTKKSLERKLEDVAKEVFK